MLSEQGALAQRTGRQSWFASVYRAELLKLSKRPLTWIVVVIVVIQTAETYQSAYLQYLQQNSEDLAMALVTLQGLQPGQVVQSLLAEQLPRWSLYALGMVIGAFVGGSEYAWGTVKTITTQSPSRVRIYLAQLLAVLSVLAVLAPLIIGLNFVASLISVYRLHTPPAWPTPLFLLQGVAVTFVLLTLAASMGMMLSVLLRNTPLAIGAGLGWFLVVEEGLQIFGFSSPPITALLGWLPETSGDSLAISLGQWSGDLEPPSAPASGSASHFIGVLVAYIVLFSLVGALRFTRTDIDD